MNHGLYTPPSSPPLSALGQQRVPTPEIPAHRLPSPPPEKFQYQTRKPPTPESRIGIFLGASLELKGILGTGAYGVVYSALDHHTQTWYAVKALSKTNPNGEPLDRRQREFQSREIQLHYAASAHPNIVSMLKIVDDPDCTYVVLEYCQEGDLFSNITERCRYVSNDVLVRRAFLQILEAVEHCHRLGIYHRDLKPENILVSNSGNDVLLADFGLATTASESDDHGCGSTFYMSPECLDQSSRKPSYRCAPNDIWSLGVILVNLSCGRNPWKQASVEDSTYKAFTKDPNFLKTILPLSDDLNSILCRIFERNPEERITIGELKRRISLCSNFSKPSQSRSAPVVSKISTLSDQGSDISDDSSSTLSDVSDCDSGYASSPDSEKYRQIPGPSPPPTQTLPPYSAPRRVERPAPTAPLVQQYVLPSQDCHGNPWQAPVKVPNPYANPWNPMYHQQQQFVMHPASVYGNYGQPINYYPCSRECW